VAEDQGRIVFLRRVEPGGSDRSYGIQVARLAGLPASVTARAEDILRELDRSPVVSWAPITLDPVDGPTASQPDPHTGAILDELLAIDLATTTPLQALNALAASKERARQRDD
jgi:DNA mismatch repair protein MutS